MITLLVSMFAHATVVELQDPADLFGPVDNIQRIAADPIGGDRWISLTTDWWISGTPRSPHRTRWPREGRVDSPKVADANGDGREDFFAETHGGELVVRDVWDGSEIARVPAPSGILRAAGDIYGTGVAQALFDGGGSLTLVDVQGQVLWSVPGTLRNTILGQLDADPQLEIISEDVVRDGRTGQLETGLAASLPPSPRQVAGDVTGDGLDDVLGVTYTEWLLWDPALPGVRWSVPFATFGGFAEPVVTDLDLDGIPMVYTPADNAGEDVLAVLDGVTGQVDHAPTGDHSCYKLYTAHFWSVRPTILCSAVNGGLVSVSANGHQEVPLTGRGIRRVLAMDLDGDGDDEIVALGQSVSVYAPDGRPLRSGLRVDESFISIDDWDGDGQLDLATTDQGVRLWDWSPSTGFVPGARVTSFTGSLAEARTADLDADGRRDILFVDHAGDLVRLDLLNGGTDRITQRTPDAYGIVDLDLDGQLEIWTTANEETRVFDATGRLIDLINGTCINDALGAPHDRIVISGNDILRFYTRGPAQLYVDSSFPVTGLQRGGWWVDERLWYGAAAGLEALQPSTQTIWRFDSGDPLGEPVVVDGSVWVVAGGLLQRWELP